MRTKECYGIWRADVTRTDPRPNLYLAYDGLLGLHQRNKAQDLLDEISRKGPKEAARFLTSLKERGSGEVQVYFMDYVSYGIGGGEATAEFFLGTYLVLWQDAKHPFRGQTAPGIVMLRAQGRPGEAPKPTDERPHFAPLKGMAA